MVPFLALHFEHDDDPECRPTLIDDDSRQEIPAQMIAAIPGIYRYFSLGRTQGVSQPVQNQQPKIGGNDPCYCGSGKKFKYCHGAVTLH